MDTFKIVKVDLECEDHCIAVIELLNEYMLDEMGIGERMSEELAVNLIKGLKEHKAYIGFLVSENDKYIGLANCNTNFSTWRGKFLINIHDFVVHSEYRQKGVGAFLMKEIENYAINNDFCKLNLEVRVDNQKAKQLYKKAGFKECNPSMLFWEKSI